ncbi:poliovirus receptor homolog [Sorex araneus]|uniref:poliovirus receptor homolog n=1 Tax=Sorex araneus TaxID=42254 RepID=UPI002433D749|nr:poliovirus receptor homolog [Sorex araneus]XP_055001970.1 poliovirus receptor homolog [Sorex araneus]
MAWTGTLPGLTLLLPLLLPPWTPTRATNEMTEMPEMTVWAPIEVHGRLGDIVKLPCELQFRGSGTPKVTQVTWTRRAPSGESSVLAALHPLSRPSISERGHVEFASEWWGPKLRDASLLVRGLQPEDEANYTCEVTMAHGGTRSAAFWLRVFYAPQVSISLYDDIGQQSHRETSLTCDARSNPEPKSYNWSTTMGPLPPCAVPQGSRLLIQPTEESINTTFICCVSNALGTGQAAMRVQLPGSPQELSPSLSALWISLCISGIVVVAVLVALVYSWGRRQSRQDPHSAPDHRPVSYAAVQSEAGTSQDPPTEDKDGPT